MSGSNRVSNGLTEEKNLWQVYLKARRFPGTTFNTFARAGTIGLLVVFCIANEFCFKRSLMDLKETASQIRSWADAGIGFGSQVLGFLIAGFTIFATLSKPQLFIDLSHAQKKGTQVSQLKFMFFNFLMVFIHYVAFLWLCVFIKLFGQEGGATTKLLSWALKNHEWGKALVLNILFIGMGFWFVNILILLKSFVWNVYQSVILSILYEEERSHSEPRKAEQ